MRPFIITGNIFLHIGVKRRIRVFEILDLSRLFFVNVVGI
jgi:hypothetical protein